MNKLEELIQQLCPDGVEYKPLSELFDTKNGYTPSKSNPEFWTNGTIPWFRMEDIRENGRILSKATQYVSRSAVKGNLFPANSIIVATSATIGEHALITVPSLANQRFTYLVLKDLYKNSFEVKFLYYYCFKLDSYCKKCLNQGNFASVDIKKFAKFKFPMVSLEIQRTIVQILDKFTELITELNAELTARKKQYEYYRDKLLSIDSENWTTLGNRQLFNFHYGKGNTIPKGDGVNPVYGCNGIVGTTNTYNCEDVPIVGHIGSAGIVSWGAGKIFVTYNGTICDVIDRNLISTKFLFYFLQSANLPQYVKGSQPFLSVSDFERVKFPIISIEDQHSIVSILDKFDALCNDLTSGLPAEIAARQKQYEYYLDKLLTFKKKTSDSVRGE